MDPILQKFRLVFLEEASALLDQLEKDLLELEKSPEKQDLIESAFRAMHTIKGVSGMYGFEHVSEFTHNLENLYQSICDKTLLFGKQVFDITFLSIDHIRKLLIDEQLKVPENRANQNSIMANIHILLESTEININNNKIKDLRNMPGTWHILIRANEQIYFRGISITSLFHELTTLGRFEISRLDHMSDNGIDTWSIILYSSASETEIREVFMFIEDDCTITRLTNRNLFEDSCSGCPEEQSIMEFVEYQDKKNDCIPTLNDDLVKNTNNTSCNKAVKRISVDSAKLDHLMYLVSELITLNSQFNLNSTDAHYEKIWPYTERLDNLSKQFRNNALDIRLVPLSESILRFKRLIRDLSRQLGKEVELVTEGIDTEVDKGTIDQLNDPLMHIIRNCIDHGIEMPQIRKQKGKPECGTIRISANNSGNFVIIRIEDDGSGMDLEKIKQKAVEKGLIKASEKPSRQELLEMIFLPGFSTAQSLTEVSGRGVGMDVVKRKIIELRGEVIVDTEPGIGTSFTLRLQQSVSIIDTLLFKVQETFFTVPISDINICIQIPSLELQNRKNTCTLPFENQLIPYINVRSAFNLGGSSGEFTKAVILKNNDRQLALLADTIIGGHQAVLKPLGNLFREQKCIGAASQLGDGKLAFMLDTNELFLSAECF